MATSQNNSQNSWCTVMFRSIVYNWYFTETFENLLFLVDTNFL